jgi:hypothetical protein
MSEVIITPDGRVLQEKSPPRATRVEIPTRSQAQRLVVSARRKLVDLPALPKQLNALSAVLVYSLSGLSDDEISLATGMPAPQVASIRNTPAYCALESNVVQAVRENFTGEAADILIRAKRKAAEKLEAHMDSEFDAISLRAAETVLSKAAEQIASQRSGSMEALHIEIVDKRDATLPSLDVGG